MDKVEEIYHHTEKRQRYRKGEQVKKNMEAIFNRGFNMRLVRISEEIKDNREDNFQLLEKQM